MGAKSGKKGPDPIELPREQVLDLAMKGWKHTEIAAHYKVSTDTLYRRIPAAELDAAYERGNGRIKHALWDRAMGGKIERTQPDGSVKIYYHDSNIKMLIHLANRRLGAVPKEVNLNPQAPVHVKVQIDPIELRAAVQKLEEEY